MNFSWLERRWARDIFATMFPGGEDPRLAVGAAELDTDAFLTDLARHLPTFSLMGVRLAIVAIALLPLFLIGKFRTFRGLGSADRVRVLNKMYASNIYELRGLVTLLKCMGGLFYAGASQVRGNILGAHGASASGGLVSLRLGKEAVRS